MLNLQIINMVVKMEWKKSISYLIIALVVLGLFGNLSQACGPNEPAGKSHVSHLYLYEKNPTTWDVISNGSWGKMKYGVSGEEFEFVFNGHNLTSGQNYTLIYYPDPWPGEGLICLGNGTANEEGNVHIAESVDTGNLPSEDDENECAKIWLVLSSDVDCENSKMIGWNPAEYLFEHNLINFSKTSSEESSEKCDKGTTVEETEDDEDVQETSEADKPKTKRSKTSLLFLDKLIERFPIIEKILQLLLQIIYNQLASMEQPTT